MSTSNVAPISSVANTATLPAAPRRMENTTACLPLVCGSVAFYLGKKASEFHTHQWTLYLRGPNNEDLSHVISKVVFQLHASFSDATREQTEPPYELTETGWGEFEAQIRVHWKDPSEKPVFVSQFRGDRVIEK
jgi:YEATS domain-containing protein 4